MKIAIVSLMALCAAGTGFAVLVDDEEAIVSPAQEQQADWKNPDADELYDLVKRARDKLRETRVSAGLDPYAPGPRAGQGGGEHGREGRGEHDRTGGREVGERGERGEEGGAYLPKMAKQDKLFANGARLVLQFNPNTQVFVGSVTNTTGKTLPQVRVEVHLDDGTELGPTRRIDVAPGRTIPVELGAFGNSFASWVSHPEAGIERGHGTAGEEGGEGRGEHAGRGGGAGKGRETGEREGHEGGGEEGREAAGHGGPGSAAEGARPLDPAYRPLYNQLRILRGEMEAFEAELKARSGPVHGNSGGQA